MNPFKKFRPGTGEMIILLVIGVLALIVVTGNHETILNTLWSPTAVLIVIIMLIEYLILKGSDRTAIYRRELEAAREKRRDDLLALRSMENLLVDLRARLDADLKLTDDAPAPEQGAMLVRTQAAHARNQVEEVLKLLRERI